ncbi:MAG: alpha/beta fold hydrolase [Prochloraceae cyanobacterium]|nr:alpha/beta fold hydrolase [Prochloraceae cyanobacterium]
MKTQQIIPTNKLDKFSWNWQDREIKYTVMGEGQPIVLIHGFGASIGHWRKNIPVLAENGYRVYALDLLGFGESDQPAIDYTLELWQELIKDFWAAHINQPAVFVGNSIGGLLSLMVNVNHSEIAKGGVLINCAGGLNHRPEELVLPLRVVMGTFTRVVSSSITGPFIFNLVRRKSQIRRSLYQVYSDRTAVTDELVEMIYQPACQPDAQKVFASILTAPPGPQPTELLPNLERPLLVLWGDKDPWTPIKGAKIYQDRAEDNSKNTDFYPIVNAGHCPHDEKPEAVNDYILNWLEQLN